MLIGIKGLEPHIGSIEMPGLFVMTVPTFSFAKSVLLQTIICNPSTSTAMISFEKNNELFNVTPEINEKLFDIYDAGNLLLNIVCINDGKHLLSKIRQDMEKKAFAMVDLILIDIEQDIFMSITDGELSTILSSWQSWLTHHKKTCVWIVHGDMATSFIKDNFLSLNNRFNGLANIEFDVCNIKYEVVFWHLYSAIQSNILLGLLFDEDNNEISVTENNEVDYFIKDSLTLSHLNRNRVLVVKPKDELQEVFPCEWEIANSFDEFEGDISEAIIVIYINTSIDINFMVNKIIELRKGNGGRLKIILREMEQCLRGAEEKIIINSGANLVIPYGVVFLRFITIIYAMQRSYLIRNIPNNIEDIYKISLNEYGKNYSLLNDFVRQVISLVDFSQRMNINSSLIKLTINRAIPVEEVTALLKIKRSGDIFTFTQDYLYVFLFQCEEFELRQALPQLVGLPIEDLFLAQEFFCGADEIRNEIKEILAVSNNIERNQKDEIRQVQMIKSIALDAEKKAVRRAAVSSPLHLKLG